MVPLGSNIHSYESGCNDGVLQICHSRIGRVDFFTVYGLCQGN